MRMSRFVLPFAILAGISGSALATANQPHQRVEVAFVLDTTGSMGDLIDGAKKKIWSIASTPTRMLISPCRSWLTVIAVMLMW
jgi:hypothetical protein